MTEIYDYPSDQQYLLLRSEVKQIIQEVINEAQDAWSWGEGIDIEVLWLRLDRDILQTNVTEL
jgi:hypothetical protein